MYVKELFGETAGVLSSFDYSSELKLWELVIEANKEGLLKSAKDVNLGGVAVSLSKMAAVSGKGIIAKVSVEESKNIFDESQSRAFVEVNDANLDEVLTMASGLELRAEVIGKVGGDKVKVNDVELSMEKVKDIYFNTFERIIEQDL